MLILKNAALTVYNSFRTTSKQQKIFQDKQLFSIETICRVGYTYSPDTRQQIFTTGHLVITDN